MTTKTKTVVFADLAFDFWFFFDQKLHMLEKKQKKNKTEWSVILPKTYLDAAGLLDTLEAVGLLDTLEAAVIYTESSGLYTIV